MGDIKGFLKVKREAPGYRPVCERVGDYAEVMVPRSGANAKDQASRCMDCGTPFCHWACPIGNYIPEWNDALFCGNWHKAFGLLDISNPLPEVTGRVCPALCEYSCVLGINDEAVTIRQNELDIAEYALRHGIARPDPPKKRTGRKIAVIGSGPAGLSCAAGLNRLGHKVVVFEKDDAPGGIMRYGIPDFKLGKEIIGRRIAIWKKEGIEFRCGINAGVDLPAQKLMREFDAVCLAVGCRIPRDLNIEGRELEGIYFAMDYLTQANKRAAGIKFSGCKPIDARGKRVVVIGGGDTGADCVGTALRQKASCVTQIELFDRPPECRSEEYPWPMYPRIYKASSSHQEGGRQRWGVITKRFIGKDGKAGKLSCARADFSQKDARGCPVLKEAPGSAFEIEADLVILAMGFLHPEKKGLIESLGVSLEQSGNVNTDKDFMTSVKGVFCAGDSRRGQSLIVWAISEGLAAAASIHRYLQK